MLSVPVRAYSTASGAAATSSRACFERWLVWFFR